MAIEGKGTEASPWVVYNHEQMVEAFAKNTYDGADPSETYTDIWIKLGSDIDYNNYDSSWEWTPIEFGYQYSILPDRKCNFDLNNHTIKNAYIPTNSHMFSLRLDDGSVNPSSVCDAIKIKNGNILNIFTNKAKYICEHATFTNTSTSWLLDTTAVPFDACNFNESSVYFASKQLPQDTTIVVGHSSNDASKQIMRNCDIYFAIDDCNRKNITTSGYPLFRVASTSTTATSALVGCRLRGSLGKNCNSYELLTNAKVVDTVIDLLIPEYKDTSEKYSGLYLIYNVGASTGVLNTEKINGGDTSTYFHSSKMTECNTEQLKDADWLNENGFFVVKTNETLTAL